MSIWRQAGVKNRGPFGTGSHSAYEFARQVGIRIDGNSNDGTNKRRAGAAESHHEAAVEAMQDIVNGRLPNPTASERARSASPLSPRATPSRSSPPRETGTARLMPSFGTGRNSGDSVAVNGGPSLMEQIEATPASSSIGNVFQGRSIIPVVNGLESEEASLYPVVTSQKLRSDEKPEAEKKPLAPLLSNVLWRLEDLRKRFSNKYGCAIVQSVELLKQLASGDKIEAPFYFEHALWQVDGAEIITHRFFPDGDLPTDGYWRVIFVSAHVAVS